MEPISRCKDKIIFRQSKPASPAFNTHLIPRSPQFRPERPQETIWGKKSAFCTKVQNAESGAADLADAVGGTDHQLVAENRAGGQVHEEEADERQRNGRPEALGVEGEVGEEPYAEEVVDGVVFSF